MSKKKTSKVTQADAQGMSNRECARERLNGRELIFGQTAGQAWQFDAERFRRFAAFAAEFGGTHVGVSLPFCYNSWVLPDNVDPYAAWCVSSVGILRVCPPPELQKWVPLKQAKEAQAVLQAQLKILRQLGLRAVTHAVEPMWLPEGVYRAHPRWRGAQCELGRIASRPYFAPSIDEPEVLDLYRRAMKEFATVLPEIDQLAFLSNDSGAGLGWAPCLYPGMNGSTYWRTRDGGARISGWLAALRAGAAEAKASVRFQVASSGLPPEWVASARAKLEPGLFVNGIDAKGERLMSTGAGMGGGMWDISYPAMGLGNPAGLVAGLQSVYHNPAGKADRGGVHFDEDDLDIARMAFEACLAEPGQGSIKRAELALTVAEQLAGKAGAETLLGVWEQVSRAQLGIGQVRQKGFSLPFLGCTMMARWLVRPLVLRPENLTRQETAHYRDVMFATEPDRDNPHFGLIGGKGVFRGEGVTWSARWSLHEASQSLKGARATVLGLAERAEDAGARGRLRLYAARIGALACLAENVKNTVMYQYALDTIGQPQYGPNMMDYDDNITYDLRTLNLRKIAREELDNIGELIELIESVPGKVVAFADTPDAENPFMHGPDMVAQLRRKMTIMMDHWQEYEQLYPTTKVWDFDPPATGNVVTAEPPSRK